MRIKIPTLAERKVSNKGRYFGVMMCRCLFAVPGNTDTVTGLDLHFLPLGENKGSAPSSRRRQCSSALHLDGFESNLLAKK